LGTLFSCPHGFHFLTFSGEFDFACTRCLKTFFILPFKGLLGDDYWANLSDQVRTTARHEKLLRLLNGCCEDLLCSEEPRGIKLSSNAFKEHIEKAPLRCLHYLPSLLLNLAVS